MRLGALLSLSLSAAALAACDADPGDVMPGPPWIEGTSLPAPRVDPGVTTLGQRLAVVGGREGGALTASALWLDPVAEVWDPLPPMPIALADSNVTSSSATLYVLGGVTDDAAIGDAYALDVARPNAAWRSLRSMPAGLERGGAAVVITPPNVFVIGGVTPAGAVATTLAYDTAADQWTESPPLPAPRSHAAAMRLPDGTLIVAGGRDGAQAFAEVWALPLFGDAWQPRAPMAVARGGCAYGVVVDQLICAGGEAGGVALAATESYDPFRDVWMTLPDMPAPRTGTRGAVFGGRLYVPGGTESPTREPAASVYVFSFLDTLVP